MKFKRFYIDSKIRLQKRLPNVRIRHVNTYQRQLQRLTLHLCMFVFYMNQVEQSTSAMLIKPIFDIGLSMFMDLFLLRPMDKKS